MPSKNFLQISNLHFGFPGKKVLKGISFKVKEGEVLGVIGESGSGKTSLMRILSGLATPAKGSVKLEGKPLATASELLIPGYEQIKLVHQDFDLMPMLTVEENIVRQLKHLSDYQQQQRALKLRKLLKLSGLRNRRADQLSGGQRQRIAIATAIASQPKVLLLDEAFSNLDYPLKRSIIQLLKTEWKPSMLIIVGHEPAELLSLCSRILVLEEGRIIQDDKAETVFLKPINSYAGRLMGPLTHIDAQQSELLGLPPKNNLLRPFELEAAKKGMAVTVSHCEFNGRDYLCTARSEEKKSEIYFFHPQNIDIGNKINIRPNTLNFKSLI